jgi:hypothetical protein
VAFPASWRRARQFFRHFRIDAPRMAVRSRLPWPWRAFLGAALLAIVGGMWWWGFDFGQIFGGFNRKEIEARVAALDAENGKLRGEASELRAKSAQQEAELAMTRGAQATLSKQVLDLSNENTQLKEENMFLQKLVADSSKQVGLSIQRFAVERQGEDAWRYSLLVVRGGNPHDELEGTLSLQFTLQPAGGPTPRPTVPTVLTLPDDQPESAPTLKLRFKYYQRVEGTIHVPEGALVRSATARAFEAGTPSPRATKTLVIS